jgi:hypothetical protein
MKASFPIIPASNGPVWLFVCVSVFSLALIALFGYLTFSSRHVVFDVSSESLQIRGDLYGRRIPLSSLDLARAKPVDLTRDREYQLVARTNGSGLPGYSAGWFRMRKGEKCLAFVTDPHRVLYVPTRVGYSVVMSVHEPEALLDELRKASSGL